MRDFIYRCCVVLLLLLFPMIINSYAVFAKDNMQKICIKVNGYVLECGIYKGYETDYNHKTQKPFKKLVAAEIGKNKITINGITTKLKVKGSKLYIGKNEMYEIIDNNKFLMLAGGGIIFEHE